MAPSPTTTIVGEQPETQQGPQLGSKDGLTCCCATCNHSRRDLQEPSCDRERPPHHIQAASVPDDMFALRSTESYPDVPRTASSTSLPTSWSAFPDESAIDIVLPTQQGTHVSDTEQPHRILPDQQLLQRELLILPPFQNRNPSPQLFPALLDHSNLSLAASFEGSLTLRPAPVQPVQVPPQNVSMTFVAGHPFFRRADDRETFPCQICMDDEPFDESVTIQACGHMFGKECMRAYILAKLDERRFPIPCPCCSVDETGAVQALVTSGIAIQVSLSDADCARWDELEFMINAVRFDCSACGHSLSMDRRKLVKEKAKKKVHCQTPGCKQVWCRTCHAVVNRDSKQKHVCEGRKELKKLMRLEGWKSCPGCNIPVQKSAGCNHIACSAPGCNTHFCYRCGQILIRSVFGSEIHNAISSHFRRRLYFWRCSQFHDPNFFARLFARGRQVWQA